MKAERTVEELALELLVAIQNGLDPDTPVRMLNDVFTEEPIVPLYEVAYRNKQGTNARKLSTATEVVLFGKEDDDL
jgi:hypothetical protein